MRRLLRNKPNANPNLLSHIIIATLTCLSIVTIIQWDRGLFKAEFQEGDIALRDIYAPYDFNIRGELNSVAMDLAKKKAQETVLPIYIYDEEVQASVIAKANSITGSLKSLKDTPDMSEEDLLSKTKELAPLYNISEALLSSVVKLKDLDKFFNYSKEPIEYFMQQGVISNTYYLLLKDQGIGTIRVIEKAGGNEKVRFAEDLFTLEDLKEKVKVFSSSIIKDKKERDVVTDFVNSILNVNLSYDKEATESEKRLKAEEVQPIYNIIEVKRNESILSKGERIGKDHIEKLKGIEQSEPSVMKAGGAFAILILVGLFMLVTVLYLKFYEPSLAAGNKELVLLSFITILMLIVAKAIVMSPWPSNLVPVAVASMLIAILINSRLAIITTCFLSVLIGMISGNRLDIAGMSLVGGIIGIFAMKGVRRRSQVITAGLCVGFANMSYLIGMGLIRALDFKTAITESFFGFTSGLISAVIVTGVLPIFENIFKVTTDISLLELADLNHPILKEMVMKAPGTYHHSLVVGNLAEAACEAIKANPLLARVSSYFHDIGKIEKAPYFSENQLSPVDSAHDKLSPTMSSLIITNHVKNGVELAKKYKLNRNIIDIINQHHGTGLVFYFFKRALEKVTDEEVGEQSFRYPGPKPQTKEAACVLLADSVEAASRTLDDPTPSRIKGLVRKVINNKFIDGQLDECDLTLKDLERISEVFTHILTGIFHTRVKYPEEPER